MVFGSDSIADGLFNLVQMHEVKIRIVDFFPDFEKFQIVGVAHPIGNEVCGALGIDPFNEVS